MGEEGKEDTPTTSAILPNVPKMMIRMIFQFSNFFFLKHSLAVVFKSVTRRLKSEKINK